MADTAREPHPFATLFPRMPQDEFMDLMEDIKDHGQQEPILLFEGLILDGVNRYDAVLRLGYEPIFQEFEGTDAEALAHVTSHNLFRRHMTKSQIAMIKVRMYDVCRAQRLEPPPFAVRAHEERQRAGEGAIKPGALGPAPRPIKGQEPVDAPKKKGRGRPKGSSNDSARDTAEKLGVTRNDINRARIVNEKGIPELGISVSNGDINLAYAVKIARMSQKRQRELVAQGRDAMMAAVRPEKKDKPKKQEKDRTAPLLDASAASPAPRAEAAPAPVEEDAEKASAVWVHPFEQRMAIAKAFLDPYVGEEGNDLIADPRAFTRRLSTLLLDIEFMAGQTALKSAPSPASTGEGEEERVHGGVIALATAKDPVLNAVAARMEDELLAAKHADLNVQRLRRMVEDRNRSRVAKGQAGANGARPEAAPTP
jgi:hypothetical protein